jgi:hypothetical protein
MEMKTLLRLLVRILLFTAVAATIVALIGLVFRWQTAVQFSNGLFWAGVALAGVGLLGAFGDNDMLLNSGTKFFWSSPQERQARLAGVENPHEQAKRSSKLLGQGFNSYVQLFISAALLILIGYLITVVF